MGSSNSSAKKGGQWKNEVYFDPEADKCTGKDYKIGDFELKDKLVNLVGASQPIIKVYAYKHSLSKLQFTNVFLYHAFIVFQTKDWWWWSIEKNSEVIAIQRSIHEEDVTEKFRHKSRNEPTLMNKDEGRKTTGDLVNWLYMNDELNDKYDGIFSNCQHFAEGVFNYLALIEVLYYDHCVKLYVTPQHQLIQLLMKTLCPVFTLAIDSTFRRKKWPFAVVDMGVSGSKSSSAKEGGKWKNRLYVENSGSYYKLKDFELSDKLPNIFGASQPITKVYAYKHKLSSFQITSMVLFHAFIVFQTEDCLWWSIEKNSKCISIQQNQQKEYVKEYYDSEHRNEPIFMEKDKGGKTTGDLMNWLNMNDELNDKYDWINSNCKHFAEKVFDYLAKNKVLVL